MCTSPFMGNYMLFDQICHIFRMICVVILIHVGVSVETKIAFASFIFFIENKFQVS